MSLNRQLTHLVQKVLRTFGYELSSYPPGEWVALRHVILRIFETLSIDCVLDVGANVGQYGSQLREFGYRGWIVSFEPTRDSYEALAAKAKADGRWRAFNLALGAEDGTAEFHVTGNREFSSFLSPNQRAQSDYGSAIAIEQTEMIPVKRLDGLLGECLKGIETSKLYLKIDTQGFDAQVIEGAAGIFNRIVGLQVEASMHQIYSGMQTYLETLAMLQSKGLALVDMVPVNRAADGLQAIEMDCFMVRRIEGSLVRKASE